MQALFLSYETVRKRQHRIAAIALIDVGADVVYEATHDGDVEFASVFTPRFLMFS